MFLWFLTLLDLTLPYNIDPESASIIYSAQADSLFGYSVAIHKTSEKIIYLVGAPRANTTQALASPGAIYGCDVQLSETKSVTTCDNWLKVFDSLNDHTVEFPNEEGELIELRTESKSNQYFGISLLSTNATIIGCAHLYKDHYKNKYFQNRLPIGRCVTVDQDLTKVTSTLAPCLDIADSHDSYGSCLGGASIAAYNGTVMVSAPNANNGLGNSFYYKEGGNTSKQDILELISSEWVTLGQEDVEYAGYSSVFCDINGDGVKEMILGMPRSMNYHGSIKIHYGSREQQDMDSIFGTEETPGKGRHDTEEYKNLKVMCPTQDGEFCTVPAGDVIGSYFGHSLACADLDNDGIEDLIVSAPYYSHHTQNTWLVDRGKVTIYFGSYTPGYVFPAVDGQYARKLDLYGDSKVGSNFGLSLHAGADLNNDGIKDLLVGAPHEEGGGAVYVFNGGSTVDTQFSQKITPQDLSEGLQTFGSSLDSGMNVDGLGGDDVLVGAYKSNAIVGLRSVPTVSIVPKLILLHDVLNLENTTFMDPLTGEETVGNTLRINISTAGILFPSNSIRLYWTLILDPLMTDNVDKRAYLKLTSNSPALYELKGSSLIYSNTTVTLPNIINILLKRRTIRSVKDLFVDIKGEIRPEGTFSSKYVLRHEMFRKARAEIKISTMCDQDTGRCTSDVNLDPPTVTFSEGFPSLIKDFVKFIYLEYAVTNRGPKAAYSTALNVTIPPELKFIESPSTEFTCIPHRDLVSCMFREPMYTETKNIQIKFAVNQTRLIPARLVKIKANVGVDHPSTDPVFVNNAQISTFKVRQLAELNLYGGPVLIKQSFDSARHLATAPKSIKDIGPMVKHVMEVRMEELAKTAAIRNITVEISWPLKTSNGQYALYITELYIPDMYKDDLHCDQTYIDVDGMVEDNLGKRSAMSNVTTVDEEGEEEAIFGFGGEDKKVLDCSNTQCVKIKCLIKELTRGITKSMVTLEVRSRLWEASFNGLNYLNISSVVRITSVGEDLVLPAEEQITKSIMSQFSMPNKKKTIPLLTILLAALAGLFLLLLIILILWKVGFFKRRNKTPAHLVFTGSKSETFVRGKEYSSS